MKYAFLTSIGRSKSDKPTQYIPKLKRMPQRCFPNM